MVEIAPCCESMREMINDGTIFHLNLFYSLPCYQICGVKFCTECGSQLPLGQAKFCPKCGKSLWTESSDILEEQKEAMVQSGQTAIYSLGVKLEQMVEQIIKNKVLD